MTKRLAPTVLLVLVLAATGAALAWAAPAAPMQGLETPAVSSPAPVAPALGGLERPQPIFATTCYSTYQACVASCGSNTSCKNKCRCQYLDCIGSDAPCFE